MRDTENRKRELSWPNVFKEICARIADHAVLTGRELTNVTRQSVQTNTGACRHSSHAASSTWLTNWKAFRNDEREIYSYGAGWVWN